MSNKAYGIIETLAPLHVGATAGEESGNLNLIFRDQFTQTGIIPGSSIRGRLRSEMRRAKGEDEAGKWYGKKVVPNQSDSNTSESIIKFEYASIVWLPVFCPGQPIVWVSCPRLLKRYQRIVGDFVKIRVNGEEKSLRDIEPPAEYTGSPTLKALEVDGKKKLFFNFGFVTLKKSDPKKPVDFSPWFPLGKELAAVVVKDDEIAMIHDMALYRQSRVALEEDEKRVAGKAFFNTEALPEETILVFPIALKKDNESPQWQPFNGSKSADIYLGGLESVGFGHCRVTLKEV